MTKRAEIRRVVFESFGQSFDSTMFESELTFVLLALVSELFSQRCFSISWLYPFRFGGFPCDFLSDQATIFYHFGVSTSQLVHWAILIHDTGVPKSSH